MSELDLLVLGDINPDVIVATPTWRVEFGQVEQVVAHARRSCWVVQQPSRRLGRHD